MRKAYQLPIYFLVFAYIVLKEILWTALAEPIVKYIKTVPFFQFVEEKILSKLNSYFVLLLFLMLFGLVEAIGIYALMFFAKSSIFMGLFLYVLKIPIASFAFWIYKIKKTEMHSILIFGSIFKFIENLIEKIAHSQYYVNTKSYINAIAKQFKNKKEAYLIKFAKAVYRKKIKEQI